MGCWKNLGVMVTYGILIELRSYYKVMIKLECHYKESWLVGVNRLEHASQNCINKQQKASTLNNFIWEWEKVLKWRNWKKATIFKNYVPLCSHLFCSELLFCDLRVKETQQLLVAILCLFTEWCKTGLQSWK